MKQNKQIECLFGYHDWETIDIPKEELIAGTKRGTRKVCSICGAKCGYVTYTLCDTPDFACHKKSK